MKTGASHDMTAITCLFFLFVLVFGLITFAKERISSSLNDSRAFLERVLVSLFNSDLVGGHDAFSPLTCIDFLASAG